MLPLCDACALARQSERDCARTRPRKCCGLGFRRSGGAVLLGRCAGSGVGGRAASPCPTGRGFPVAEARLRGRRRGLLDARLRPPTTGADPQPPYSCCLWLRLQLPLPLSASP